MKQGPDCQLPTVGFFPRFYGVGETYPLIEIAKYYKKLGGKVVFFSHGGQYEYLAKELECKIIKISPFVRDTTKYFLQCSDEEIIRTIKDEASTYMKFGIKTLVQTNVFFGCLLASRYSKIPLISIISATWPSIYSKVNYVPYPEEYENIFTRPIPQFIKNKVANWIFTTVKGIKSPVTRKINRIAKKMNINLHFGEYTFLCDDKKFLGLETAKDFPIENCVGPILSDKSHMRKFHGWKKLDSDILKHLKKPGKRILLTMGTSPKWKELFLKILELLNQTKYNVIATYTNIIKEDEIPTLNDNILLKKFIPKINMLHDKVDLSIIHGGRGTVYSVAYSGKPTIGYAMHIEQQGYLDNLVRHGAAIRLSKKYFSEKELSDAINNVFDKYDRYITNAANLKEKMFPPKGDEIAARKISEILQNYSKKEIIVI